MEKMNIKKARRELIAAINALKKIINQNSGSICLPEKWKDLDVAGLFHLYRQLNRKYLTGFEKLNLLSEQLKIFIYNYIRYREKITDENTEELEYYKGYIWG